MKTDPNFFKVWGGISGCQHAFPLFFEVALAEKVDPTAIVRMTASNVARRFRLAGKGDLIEGGEADLVLLSTKSEHTIQLDDLLYRHQQSPYVGRTSRVAVRETWARGETVSGKNQLPRRHPARILRPSPL